MVVFTDHALKRMKERGISKRQVLETISKPGLVREEENNLKLFRRSFGKETIEVVSEVKQNKIIVITPYKI